MDERAPQSTRWEAEIEQVPPAALAPEARLARSIALNFIVLLGGESVVGRWLTVVRFESVND